MKKPAQPTWLLLATLGLLSLLLTASLTEGFKVRFMSKLKKGTVVQDQQQQAEKATEATAISMATNSEQKQENQHASWYDRFIKENDPGNRNHSQEQFLLLVLESGFLSLFHSPHTYKKNSLILTIPILNSPRRCDFSL